MKKTGGVGHGAVGAAGGLVGGGALAMGVKLKALRVKVAKTELEKGFAGDWQKEGYTMKEGKHPGHYVVEAHHPEHGVVGKAHFSTNSTGTKLVPVHVIVAQKHRRKGIAGAMMRHAEKIFQTPVADRASHETPGIKELLGNK